MFKRNTSHSAPIGTHNITNIMSEEARKALLELSPDDLLRTYGDGVEVEGADTDSGYGCEWYFSTPSGRVVGVGHRWGKARVRGQDINKDIAELFTYWLCDNCEASCT